MKTPNDVALNQVPCPGCGRPVHDQAVGCPDCGAAVYVEHPGGITPTKHPPLRYTDENVKTKTPNNQSHSQADDRSSMPEQPGVSSQCLVAQYGNPEHYRIAIEILEKSGFSSSEVSLIEHESAIAGIRLENAMGKDTSTPPTRETVGGASAVGGAIGGAVGAATAIGPLLVAGPLVGLIAGAVGGSIISAVDRWGVDREVASKYEERVRDGKRLIVVASDDTIRLDNAERALKTSDHDSIRRFRKVVAR